MSQDYERGSARADVGATAGGRPGGGAAGTEGIGSLISGTIKDLQELMRAEVQLAKTELKEDAKGLTAAAGMLGAGALLAVVGLVWLVYALILVLDELIEERWISAGIVSLVLLAIAAILALRGKGQLSASNLKPEQTIETLKEDQQWAKQQMNSVKK